MEREAAKLAAQIVESSRYAALSHELVMRICLAYLPRYKNQKEALKAVKKQLHIIHGAFFPDKCHAKAMELIADCRYSDRELSLQLMELHPSTRERLPSLPAFYELLSPYLREAQTVLDIGCGFHPCAFPFMGLPASVQYIAGDIDHGTVDVILAFFQRLHVACDVRILDAAGEVPTEYADAAFLFKLVPVLEQQKKGLAYRLIQSIRAKTIIVTFPVKSLSGREKDMEQFYSGQFEQNLPVEFTILKKEIVGMELVYIVCRHSEDCRQAGAETEKFLPLIHMLDQLLTQKATLTIAVDGPSGSGKSSLAAWLKNVYGDCEVFHMDDFFLPPDKKTEERLKTPGGNVDWERFQKEVLLKLKQGEGFAYQPYDCGTGTLMKPVHLRPRMLNIVEGVYSHHPALRDAYDMTVFLPIDKPKQSERILKRNGKHMHRRFMEEWIPLEDLYFREMNINEKADMTLTV